MGNNKYQKKPFFWSCPNCMQGEGVIWAVPKRGVFFFGFLSLGKPTTFGIGPQWGYTVLKPFCPGGGGIYYICPPYQVFTYICANTRRSALTKFNFKFGKGQYAFYTIRLSRLGRTPLQPMKDYKSP